MSTFDGLRDALIDYSRIKQKEQQLQDMFEASGREEVCVYDEINDTFILMRKWHGLMRISTHKVTRE